MNTIVMSFHCIITYYLMLCNRYWVLFGIDQCVDLIILLLRILLCYYVLGNFIVSFFFAMIIKVDFLCTLPLSLEFIMLVILLLLIT